MFKQNKGVAVIIALTGMLMSSFIEGSNNVYIYLYVLALINALPDNE